jgi:hypothetical protein
MIVYVENSRESSKNRNSYVIYSRAPEHMVNVNGQLLSYIPV